MKHTLFIISLLLGTLGASGQGGGQFENLPKEGIIRGLIVDSVSNAPVEYANVLLYRQRDSAMVNGTISNAQGGFQFTEVPYGKFYLVIQFIGYDKTTIGGITILPQQKEVVLNTIRFNPSSSMLEGVEIIADKTQFEYKIDKKVVNVGQDLVSAGGTAVNVLENVPSVQVDIDGNVSLRGSSSFTVLIDGKPSVLSGSDALQQLPASAIKSIEIITNPSAKYDPDGMAGIINVITKKQDKIGVSGIVNASLGTNNKYRGDALFNLRSRYANFFLGADYGDEYYDGTILYDRKIYSPDTTSFIYTEGSRNRSRGGGNVKGGVDIYLSQLSTLTLSGSYGSRNSISDNSSQRYEHSLPVTTDLYTKSISKGERSTNYYDLNLNYQKKFNKPGQEITILAYYSRDMGSDSDFEDEYETDEQGSILPDAVPARLRTTEDEGSESYRLRLDYTLPLKGKAKIETGFQSRIDRERETFTFQDWDPDAQLWNYNSMYSSTMRFDRDIHAAYVTFANETGKWGYQLGLREEYTFRKINDELTGVPNTINRFDFFPTLHVSRTLSDDQQIMASYSRRIDRPDGWSLEPFIMYIDKYNIRQGNPALKPEYTDSYEVNYQKKFGGSFIAVEAFYRTTDGKITRFQEIREDGLILHTYQNLNSDESLGGEIMLNVEPKKWLRLNLSGDIYRYQIKGGNISNNDLKSSTNYEMKSNITARFGLNSRLQLNAFYVGPSVTLQGEREGFFSTSIAYRHEFFKRSLSATLQVRDLLGQMKHEFNVVGENFEQYVRFTREAPVVMLSLSYRINNYKDRQQRGENGMESNGGGGENGGGDMF